MTYDESESKHHIHRPESADNVDQVVHQYRIYRKVEMNVRQGPDTIT